MGYKLKWIAQDMRAAVIREGFARRDLARGLALELTVARNVAELQVPLETATVDDIREAERPWWVLRLSRPATEPSEKEIAVVRGAFGVPAEVEADRRPEGVLISWPMI